MTVQQTTLAVDDGFLPLTLCRSRTDSKRPSVIVVPSIFGVAPDLIAQMSELSETGATIAAIDPFWRTQPGPFPYANPSEAIQRLQSTDLAKSFADFLKAIAFLRAEPSNGRVIGLGICFGGPFCFSAAARGALHAVATWHGTRLHEFLDGVAQSLVPMKLHFGDMDPVVPGPTIEQVREAFARRDNVEIVVHQGATHGYSHRTSSAYDRAAEQAGMTAVRALIEELT